MSEDNKDITTDFAYSEEELKEAENEAKAEAEAEAAVEADMEMLDIDERSVEDDGQPTEKKPVNVRKIILPIAIVVAVLAVAYVGIGIYCNSHFYLGSTVNGVPSSGASIATVKANVQQVASDYSMQIYDEGEVTDTITSDQVDFACNSDESVISRLLDGQNGFLWPKYLIEGKNYESDELITINADKVEKLVTTLNCVKNAGSNPTQNATCAYDDASETFEIVDEVYGNTLVQETFTERLMDELENMNYELHMDTDKCYVQPTYTADSEETKSLCQSLNKVLGMSITYDLTEMTESVDKATMAGWLKVNDADQTYAYDEEAMAQFIDAMGDKYNTYGKDKNLHTSYGVDVVVKGKNYGWKIDADGELAQLKADLDAGKDVTRDFVYSSTANSHGTNDYGNTYVEINLTAQHLFMYKNGSLVIETDFVSGNPNKGNGTPVGACQVTYTTRNATLKGADYASFVNYWMPFNGNVGLHDATWRKKFGGEIYLKSGSHGCVNLPLSAAKTIYENLQKGDCILVYTLPGTGAQTTNTEAIENCITLIDTIGEVTLGSQEAITTARNAYNSLNDAEKALVTNLSVLEAAEARLTELQNPVATQPVVTDPAAVVVTDPTTVVQ